MGIEKIREEMRKDFVERSELVDGCLVAVLAKQHLLMIGPPGTAKSLLCNDLCLRVDGAVYFQWLLTKFSTPEEIFGPISLSHLEKDEYKRITAGKLPEAHIGFLDEALDLDTPLATQEGWSTVGQVKIGDTIFGANGSLVNVIGMTEIAANRDCYKVTLQNGESIVADAGHNWLCRRGRGHHRVPFKVRTTLEMANELKKNGFLQLPLPKPVQLPEQDLPIDPYVLGLWLGNGNSWNGEILMRREWADAALAEIRKSLPKARIVERANCSKQLRTISVGDTGLRSKLGDAGLLLSRSVYRGSGKSVPLVYLRSSLGQRLRLVQGLMDTDGYMQKGGTCTFSNTNENIVDGIVELLNSLGIRCSKRLTNDKRVGAKGRHKRCWKVNFRATPGMPPFLARKVYIPPLKQRRHIRVVSVKKVKSRPVRCIAVDSKDHLFLAGRVMVVTHNCFKANSAILNSLLSIVNERVYHNDSKPMPVPLFSLFGASNELPHGEELGALYDRFLLRYEVGYIGEDSGFKEMLLLEERPTKEMMSLQELEKLQAEVVKVEIHDDLIEMVIKLRGELKKEGIIVSDRRWKHSLTCLQAFALLNGRSKVVEEDLEILHHILWSYPEQKKVVTRIVNSIANPLNQRAMEILDQATEIYNDAVVNGTTELGIEANAKLKKLRAEIDSLIKNATGGMTKAEEVREKVKEFNKVIVQKCLGLE
ncbi:MAG: AAA family ATPase [Thermodesulfobacteriota bacterium]